MKNKLQTGFRSKTAMVVLAILSLTTLTLSSCTKKSDSNDAAKFVGTWNGTSTCGGAATLTFSAGSGSTVTIPGTVGAGSCETSEVFTLTASGNNMAYSGSYQDLCGNTITMALSGSISGSTLTFTLSASGAGQSGSCVFTGTK